MKDDDDDDEGRASSKQQRPSYSVCLAGIIDPPSFHNTVMKFILPSGAMFCVTPNMTGMWRW